MNTKTQFENENLKGRTFYIIWLVSFLVILFGLQFLKPVIKGKPISTTEWAITICIAIVVTIYYCFNKQLKEITYDRESNKITLKIVSLVNSEQSTEYNFNDITFNLGKDSATLRKSESEFIEIFFKKKKLIKLERKSFGDYSFDNIVKEFKIPNKISE